MIAESDTDSLRACRVVGAAVHQRLAPEEAIGGSVFERQECRALLSANLDREG